MSGRSALPPAIALILSITACGDGPSGPVGTPDTTPPSITAITPVDVAHFDVTFDEGVTEASAQDPHHYLLLRAGALSRAASMDAIAPGDSMEIEAAVLKADSRTVAITIWGAASGVSMVLNVDGVADQHGNQAGNVQKSFTMSTLGDVNAPRVVRVSPAAGAVGASIGTHVVIQFSEALDYDSIYDVLWRSGATPVSFYFDLEGATLTLWPMQKLPYNATQTISLPATITDHAGNALVAMDWSFTTTSVVDNTPPFVVSTSPADRATRVNVNANIIITFSEAMNEDRIELGLEPWLNGGDVAWSADGKTLTIDPDGPLAVDQQYLLEIYPGGMRDLAGNTIVQGRTVVFTTGAALERGSIAGFITGDPGSAADDPTGAIVSAEADTTDYYRYTLVASNDTYTISNLPDGAYYLYVYMDTNGDGRLDAYTGDAIGAYGVNLDADDTYLDPVTITGGSHKSGISFPIYDPTAIVGTVTYAGVDTLAEGETFVGLFKVAGFNPSNPVNPVASTGDWMASYGVDFFLNSIPDQIPDGDYYLFAYMNLNELTTYEPGVDAAGMYGGMATPTVLHIRHGNDFLNVRFAIEDPRVASNSVSVSWPARKHDAGFKRLCDRIRQSQLQATR